MDKLTRELLADYASVLNRHGPKSQEAKEFLEQYLFHGEFQELARIATTLKEALVDPVPCRDGQREAEVV
jgi:hypothetical protein